MPYDLLFIDHNPAVLGKLEKMAKKHEWTFVSTTEPGPALEQLDRHPFKVVIAESRLTGLTGLQLLEWLKTLPHTPQVIILASQTNVDEAVKVLKLGAFDYLPPSFENDRISFCVRQALEKFDLLEKLQRFQEKNTEAGGFDNIIGKSPKMQALFEMVRTVASSEANILLQGESGTGKELIAKAIHRNSPLKDKPFVVINCAALPESLFESELFGYTKGSFTGAIGDKPGLFETANGGTVFLDEIGEVPLGIQVKLLRVLQEGEIRRVGENMPRFVDVRIIAASNKNLGGLVNVGKFREDLFYRLNVIGLQIPALRERPEDIPLLASYFLKKFSEKMSKRIGKIAVDAVEALKGYQWPGNVRELENIMERAVVLSGGDTITAKNLPPKILSSVFYNLPQMDTDLASLSYKEAKKRALNIFNRSYIIGLLEKADGNITAASEKAGMDRSNFKKIVKKYHIESNS